MQTQALFSQWFTDCHEKHISAENALKQAVYDNLGGEHAKANYRTYLSFLQPVYAAMEQRIVELKDESAWLRRLYPNEEQPLFRATPIQKDLAQLEGADESVDSTATVEKIQGLKPLELIAWGFSLHMAPLFGGAVTAPKFRGNSDWETLCNYYTYPAPEETKPRVYAGRLINGYKRGINAYGKVLSSEDRTEFFKACKEVFQALQPVIDSFKK